MNTLNIEALRKTQASIADLTHPFNMLDWGICIYGHANLANGWSSGVDETARRLGVDYTFFLLSIEDPIYNRDRAIARLQVLIDAAQPTLQPEPEPELVCA